MGWFSFDDYDLDIATAGIRFPLDPLPEYELFGIGENDGHPSDWYDALEPEIVKQNERALYYSLTANELTKTITPTQGHDHNSEKTILQHLPPVQVGGSNALGGTTSNNGFSVVDSTTFKKWGWGVLQIPSGHIKRPVLFPKARGSLNTHANILDVKVSLHEGVSGASTVINSVPIYTQVFRLDASASAKDRVWFEGSPIQLVGLTAFPVIDGKRLLYLKIETRVNLGQGILHEVELSWTYGL